MKSESLFSLPQSFSPNQLDGHSFLRTLSKIKVLPCIEGFLDVSFLETGKKHFVEALLGKTPPEKNAAYQIAKEGRGIAWLVFEGEKKEIDGNPVLSSDPRPGNS